MVYLLALIAFSYQVLAILAVWLHLRKREPQDGFLPGVSILKPVHGLDPNFYEAIRSHAIQDYPEFEILFGVSDPDDPAIEQIWRLAREFPALTVRLVHSRRRAPNGKAAVLEDLAAAARHPVLVINDSDIHVPADYLRRVVAPLADPGLGVVTCLYRAESGRWAGRFEALGISTDFAPSVLVARLVGVKEFGLGSTLALRAADLAAGGGFAAISDFLADDYQLARRIAALGRHIHLSKVVVRTSLPGYSWRGMWEHQVRWRRTVRVTQGKGYLGLPVTFATLWALVLAGAGAGWLALAVLAARFAAGLLTAGAVLRCPLAVRYFYLIPVRDLLEVFIWAAGLFGTTVRWRDRKLVLSAGGRIRDLSDRG